MTLRSAILAALLACTAQARTLYVSTTGSHKYGSATDATTNANHGSPIGGVTASTNSPFAGERSAAFDGASGYLEMENGYNIGTNDFTLEYWFKLNTATNSGFAGKSSNVPKSGRYAAYFIPPSMIRFLVQYGGTDKIVESIGWTPETGKWEHVAATWERDAGLTLYLNGASNAFTAAVNSDDLALSESFIVGVHHTRDPQFGRYLNGSLSDVRIWNVARTPEQIAENYTNRLTGTEEGLVGYWPLDDGEDLYSFKTPATAATNIQAAIDAASSGDTVRVAPGTYFSDNGTNNIIAITNKSNLSVIGGNGTLFDADRTILDAGGSASARPIYVTTASNRVAGFTAMNTKVQDAVMLNVATVNCTLDSLIVRNNDMSGTQYGSGIKNLGGPGNEIRNCIVVGNGVGTDSFCAGICNNTYLTGVGICRVANCVVEANTKAQLSRHSGTLTVANTIHGNVGGTIVFSGGNVTSNTTNSVMRALDIAPASEGVGTNLVWRGVSAYIPRLGSLARKNGRIYAGIATASDGAGGPALVTSRPFLGRDVSTNRNHGSPIGGVTASTNSPFAGERSAAFDGASGAVYLYPPIPNLANDFTVELWAYRNKQKPQYMFYQGDPVATAPLVGISDQDDGAAEFDVRSANNTLIKLRAGTFQTTNWVHLALVWRAGEKSVRGYVNGVQVGGVTNANANDTTFSIASFGNQRRGGSYWFDGNISDVRIWNVARTPEQIAAAYTYTNRLTGTEEGLVGYWPLTDPAINPVDSGPFNLDNPIIHPSYHEAF